MLSQDLLFVAPLSCYWRQNGSCLFAVAVAVAVAECRDHVGAMD